MLSDELWRLINPAALIHMDLEFIAPIKVTLYSGDDTT